MSTDKPATNLTPMPVKEPLSLRDLTGVLINYYGIHEGHFELLVEFQFGLGAVGPDPAALIPGAMIGVSRIGLVPSKADGLTTVDAAIVNPVKKSRKKTSA